MCKIVDNYCSSCETCARRRLGSPRPIAPLGALRAAVNFALVLGLRGNTIFFFVF
jgi:hypothetical protein